MKKDILTILDLEQKDFEHLFDKALALKEKYKKGIADRPCEGKSLGLIFDKPSTRTRVSFEAAMLQLGGTPIFLSGKDTQLTRNEPIRDTVRVLSRYVDILAIRTFSQDLLAEFAAFASIPVINALTDLYHPCQVLSDILTIIEKKGGYKGLKIAWVGDGNNMTNSWINAASVLGLKLFLACPDGYAPNTRILENALKRGHGEITVTTDPAEAARDADVLYTDVWVSMGQDDDHIRKKQVFEQFQINQELLKKASKDAIVMHCLPAHRGEEISEDVLEGPHSVVWDQAENKLHMHKAIIETLIFDRIGNGT